MLKAFASNVLQEVLNQYSPCGSLHVIIEILTNLVTGRLGVGLETVEGLDRPLTLNLLLMQKAHQWQHAKLNQWDNIPLTVRLTNLKKK